MARLGREVTGNRNMSGGDIEMMKCRDVAEIASDYLDHELGIWSRLEVRLHLFACRHCRAYVGNLRLTIAALQGRNAEGQASEAWLKEIDQRIQAALDQRSRH